MPDNAMWNRQIETLPRDELQSLQRRLLTSQLAYVSERSPFYRQKWADAGVQIQNRSDLSDLRSLPFTIKDELRRSQLEYPPLGNHVCADLNQIIRIHSSSGTTGRPSYVGITRNDREGWTEMLCRSLYAAGVRPDSIIVYAFSIGFFVGGLPNKDAIETIGATLIPVGVGHAERLISSIKHLGADMLTCTPSYAAYLAQHVREKQGLDPRALGIRTIITGGEPGGSIPGTRHMLEDAWGAKVYDAMGSADIAPVFLTECPEQAGMHFMGQEFLLPELIDPKTGEALPTEGLVTGELVVTHLQRDCVPLVRFRTGDRVEVDYRPCACGRSSFRLSCVGRTDDMLIVRGVNVFPSAIKDVITTFRPRTTGEMLVELNDPGPQVAPPVRVLVEYAPACASELESLSTELEEALRSKLIFRAKVELVPHGSLPRYEMKAKLVRIRA